MEKGTVLIVVEPGAEEIVLQAIKKAYEERGVKVQMVPQHELAGVKKEEARKAKEATRGYTSEQGYMEAERWINSRFSDPEVPKKWLKERRPDLYKALFDKETQVSPQLKATAEKLTRKGLSDGLIKYLDKHSEVNAVFFQRGGRTATSRTMGEHSKKFFGNFIFDNRWELMNKAATFPGDVWRLAEERIIEPLAWVDRVHVIDPEGTNFTFDIEEKQAQAWAKGGYQQGHLYMFPHQATGRFPYSTVDYPAFLVQLSINIMTYKMWTLRAFHSIIPSTGGESVPRKSPWIITLSTAERERLEAMARKYTSSYRDVIRAKIALFAAGGLDNDEIAARLDTSGKSSASGGSGSLKNASAAGGTASWRAPGPLFPASWSPLKPWLASCLISTDCPCHG